jgi:SSS family solute:Na+ symporter
MNFLHYAGALAVLLLITALGVCSGLRVKSTKDFASAGRKAGPGIVAGTIIGTLAGGASTIGTAQLAFVYGLSAWWFTLGGGLGCLVLAFVYARPIYESGVGTMPQILSREYGRKVATAALALTSLGTFLSIVSQVLSSIALITSVSVVPPWVAMALSVVLMVAYVTFGGVWGAGIVGVAKTILLCLGIGICGVLAAVADGGLWAGFAALPAERFHSLFARGVAVDFGAGLSLVIGLITTQTYLQGIVAGKSLGAARAGLFGSAVIVPLLGIPGILVGLYMRIRFPEMNPAAALPVFVLEYLPALIAGMVLATLLVAVVGTAAGLALGLTSMFCQDIYGVYRNPAAGDAALLRISRVVLVVILIAAALVSAGNLGSLILGWSFMSMGLRGAVAFGVLTAAIFLPGRIPRRYAMWSMIVGPMCILFFKPWLGAVIDPLFIGLAASALVLMAGLAARKRAGSETDGNP